MPSHVRGGFPSKIVVQFIMFSSGGAVSPPTIGLYEYAGDTVTSPKMALDKDVGKVIAPPKISLYEEVGSAVAPPTISLYYSVVEYYALLRPQRGRFAAPPSARAAQRPRTLSIL